jgi:hypothetical protein
MQTEKGSSWSVSPELVEDLHHDMAGDELAFRKLELELRDYFRSGDRDAVVRRVLDRVIPAFSVRLRDRRDDVNNIILSAKEGHVYVPARSVDQCSDIAELA